MTNKQHITQAQTTGATTGTANGFELDVTLVEIGDAAGLVNLTDDGCGETCGACTTNVA